MTVSTNRKIKKLVDNKTGVSQRKKANTLKINQSAVNISKIGLKYRKRTRAPKATPSMIN